MILPLRTPFAIAANRKSRTSLSYGQIRADELNRVGEAYKDFVAAGESDVLSYRFRVPEWAKGPLTISTTLKYRKLNERYARWALKEKYQPIPIVDVARNSLAVPLKIKPEVEKL